MTRPWIPLALLCALLLALPATAAAHPERTTFFPDASKGSVPAFRDKGPALYVCKGNAKSGETRRKIRRYFKGDDARMTTLRRQRMRQLRRCKFQHIQAAVDAAKSGDRIRILPGIYREEPSRAVPFNDPKCSMDDSKYWEPTNDGHGENGKVPTYDFNWECKNSRNLIQVLGDDPGDEGLTCDQKCNLEIEGLGFKRTQVRIEGDRIKKDVIRVDRADGFAIRNLTIEQASFNGLNVVEVNGFHIKRILARHNQNYGILTFTTDNGVYDGVWGHNNGDSAIYPGSGPEGHCRRYGIEVKNSKAWGNIMASSGTAGNGTWYHDNDFYENAAGSIVDSFVTGHPGMPQDCSKWTNNKIHSNNLNPYENGNQENCAATPYKDRPRKQLCPQFQVPVGTGLAIFGGNGNVVEDNQIYDQWRTAFFLFWVPAAVRGENDPTKQQDTSNNNRYRNNKLGVGPDGARLPNGLDVYWDEQGKGNCWEGNTSGGGSKLKSDPILLPTCQLGGSISKPNTTKTAREVSCATWDPRTNQDPPGCTWFDTPPRPQRR
jgi:hypothetical protein